MVKTGYGDLSQIESVEEAWLDTDEVAKFLNTTPNTLRKQARQDPRSLGFPVCILGSSIRIPKDGFLFWMRHGYAAV